MPAIKPKITLTLVLVVVLILTLGSPAPGHAQESLPLTGRVVNGTEGGETPSDLRVLLLVIDGSGSLVASAEATTGSQGGFKIMDVPAACRTYNILMGENRNVAAALLFDAP